MTQIQSTKNNASSEIPLCRLEINENNGPKNNIPHTHESNKTNKKVGTGNSDNNHGEIIALSMEEEFF